MWRLLRNREQISRLLTEYARGWKRVASLPVTYQGDRGHIHPVILAVDLTARVQVRQKAWLCRLACALMLKDTEETLWSLVFQIEIP